MKFSTSKHVQQGWVNSMTYRHFQVRTSSFVAVAKIGLVDSMRSVPRFIYWTCKDGLYQFHFWRIRVGAGAKKINKEIAK